MTLACAVLRSRFSCVVIEGTKTTGSVGVIAAGLGLFSRNFLTSIHLTSIADAYLYSHRADHTSSQILLDHAGYLGYTVAKEAFFSDSPEALMKNSETLILTHPKVGSSPVRCIMAPPIASRQLLFYASS